MPRYVRDPMSVSQRAEHLACQQDHRAFWVVIARKCNHSAFNGGHWTPSDYSAVRCDAPDCGRVWRTKAAYVNQLPDAPRRA